MPDSTLQDRFDALVAESRSPGRRVDAAAVIGRARRRRAGRLALAAAAVVAVMGVVLPAVIGVADRSEPVDGAEASPLAAAINPATADWLGPWGLASGADLLRLPDPQLSIIGCFNDGESAGAPTGYNIAWTPASGLPEGALASALSSRSTALPPLPRSWCRASSGRAASRGARTCRGQSASPLPAR